MMNYGTIIGTAKAGGDVVETKNDWENSNVEQNQSYIDDRKTDLFKPMSDTDYMYKGPKKPMTVKRLLCGVFSVTVFAVIVLALIFVLGMLLLGRDFKRKRKEEEAKAKENLRTFLCDKCGLAEDSYRIVASNRSRITFEVGDASYILRDGDCSNYYAEQFGEKLRADLSEKLAASDLLAEVPFELLNVNFKSIRSERDGGMQKVFFPLR